MIDPTLGLFVLADGMGGTRGGAYASSIASEHFYRKMRHWLRWRWTRPWQFRPAHVLRTMQQTLLAANTRVYTTASRDPELHGMGTTLVAGILQGQDCLVVAVGDSRLYRSRNGVVEQITRDQTLAERLLSEGFLDADDPRMNRYVHVLTAVIGRKERPEIQHYHVCLQPGDRLLACSDGLSGAVSENCLATALQREEPLGQLANRLVAMANDAGGKDNISLVLIDMLTPQPPRTVPQLEEYRRATATPDQG